MAANQEARMAARAVAKADTFGGDLTPCEVNGRRGVWVGPQPEVVEAEVDDRNEGGAVVGWIRKAIAKARGEV